MYCYIRRFVCKKKAGSRKKQPPANNQYRLAVVSRIKTRIKQVGIRLGISRSLRPSGGWEVCNPCPELNSLIISVGFIIAMLARTRQNVFLFVVYHNYDKKSRGNFSFFSYSS